MLIAAIALAVRRPRLLGVGCAAAALVLARCLVSAGGVAQDLGALALAFAVASAAHALLRRMPALAASRPWWALTFASFAFALLVEVGAQSDPNAQRSAIALGALSGAIGLGVAFRRRSLPGALALCGGFLVLVVATGWLGLRTPTIQPDTAPEPGPSVLLVTIDTVRADHVGAYGYARARTPTLDGLAGRGIRFENAVTSSVWTGPSHASIFTGQYPWHHGVKLNAQRLGSEVETLAEPFRAHGYATAAFIGGYTTTDSSLGIASRFHYFDDDMRRFRFLPEVAEGSLTLMRTATAAWRMSGGAPNKPWQAERQADSVADATLRWLDANRSGKFFIWVHLFDPHLPYAPPSDLRAPADRAARADYFRLTASERATLIRSPARVAQMVRLYDDEIAFADRELGRILGAAERTAGAGSLLVAVLADHGEAFGEHGLYWNRDLHEESVRLPLILAGTGASAEPGRVVVAQTRTIDVGPTLLSLCGLPPLARADGASVADAVRGSAERETPPALSAQYRYDADYHRPSFAVRTNHWKLIQWPAGWRGGSLGSWDPAAEHLFDLKADPTERTNRSAADADVAAGLRPLLGAIEDRAASPTIAPRERDALRALGYVE
ncbi:MAG TPA: sulfatase [Myxococcota bacterium]